MEPRQDSPHEIARIDLCDRVLAAREREGCDRQWLWKIRRRVLRYERTLLVEREGQCDLADDPALAAPLTDAERGEILRNDPVLRYDHRSSSMHGCVDPGSLGRWRRQFAAYLRSLTNTGADESARDRRRRRSYPF